MLLDLQAFDVDICQNHAHGDHDREHAREHLRFDSSAKGVPGNHQGADKAGQKQKDDDVAVDAVKESKFVADEWCEL